MADAELELCLLSFKLLLGAPGTQGTPQWAPSMAPPFNQYYIYIIFTLLHNSCEWVDFAYFCARSLSFKIIPLEGHPAVATIIVILVGLMWILQLIPYANVDMIEFLTASLKRTSNE